jgi:magnesium transporter
MANDELLREIRELVASREESGVAALAGKLTPAEWADVVPQLEEEEVATLVQLLPDEESSQLLAEIDPYHAGRVLELLGHEEAADLLEAMAPDDATDVLGELSEMHAEQILVAMEPADAAEIRELAAYPPDTAGGIMTPSFVGISPDLRADEAILALRRVAEEAETVYYAYVLDPDEHLLGVLSLHSLVLSQPGTPVQNLMFKDIFSVRADEDQEVAARLLTDHNLLALPVVDDDNHLLGIITQDDVADVLEEEATEDIERLGGSQPLDMPYRAASVLTLVRRRIGWLMFLFVAGFLTSWVLKAYDDRLSEASALILFIPLITGTGGNVGSQTVTTLVRAMAVGEVQMRDIWWVLTKELSVGLLVGLMMAAVAFARAGATEGRDIGLVVGLTIIGITLWAATVAAMLPLVLRRLRVDPAVVSAPLITTLVDATGLLIYVTIAGLVLKSI